MFPIDTTSDRMVAVKVRTSLGVILMIALYMPIDYGDCTAYDEHIAKLGFVEGLLDMEVYDHIVLMGDFDADLHRNESRFLASMSSLLSEYSLVVTRMEDMQDQCIGVHGIVMTSVVSHGLTICVFQLIWGMSLMDSL